MDLQLDGKCALVTGSSRGLGKEMARTLAAEGAKIIVHGRNSETAETVAHEIGGSDRVAVVLGDLAETGAVDRIASEAGTAFGGVDILVNNAGLFGPTDWNDIVMEDMISLYATNVAGPARLSSLLASSMADRRWGRLIHIGSLAAGVGLPMAPSYGASKAALAAISSSLAKHFGRHGITSNILGVGVIANMAETGWINQEEGKSDPTYEFMISIPDGHLQINPIARSGTPEEVAFMVAVLASPRSAYINGTLIRVDGGCVPTLGL
jgi:NAD(P)-dependent dehydrogenase (short-subunit alcohol dehydrogenase family)